MVTLLLAVGLLLGTARLLGECFARIGQPAVVGELAAGVLLGPTIFGTLLPHLPAALFPATGQLQSGAGDADEPGDHHVPAGGGDGSGSSSVWRQGKSAFSVSAFALAVPFLIGFCFAWYMPF
jgi:Kef-type K+ transport system membrane component KefB